MSKKVFIKTFGCQMNEYDSDKMADVLGAAQGYEPTDDPEQADLILFNTCSVREKAQEKVFSDLGRVRHLKEKGVLIGVGGCVASQEGEEIIKRAPFVDVVFGPQTLHRLPELLNARKSARKPQVDISFPEIEKFDHLPPARVEGASAFVSIMEGCSKYCSYCVVPYTRGEEVSRPLDDVLVEIAGLADQGVKEITLLGQNVNSYGKGLEEKTDFADLLNLLCTVPGDYQIRFMTSHPKDASRKLIDTIAAQDHLCKHIHLPVQSGSDRILKEMNRHYTVAQYMDLVNYAKEKIPGVTFSSDIIVGFPGETEEDFQATLDLIQQVKYMQLFTFIYSKRTGTIAAKLPDPATHAEKAARMDRLLKLQDSIAFPMIAAMAGQTVKVLVEAAGRTPGTLNGRLDNNLVVEFPAEESLIGQYANVRLTGSRAALLVGELAE